jgi:peptidoglycan/xylan/chitin deacetylase (PgdA/CDA1 family)
MPKYALFTCDTEFTPPWHRGSWEEQDRSNFAQGIAAIEEILARHGVRGTFFCQGLLVRDYPDTARRLDAVHLVGSHGYNHENYGAKPVNVWTRDQPVFLRDPALKRERLEACLDIHRRVLGRSPQVFVAPFNSVSSDLWEILEDLGFQVDLSLDNYHLGLDSRPYRPLGMGLRELPLSVLKVPGLGYKNVLQALSWDWDLVGRIWDREVLSLTCHPYEFVDMEVPHPDHVLVVGERKRQTLDRLLGELAGRGFSFTDPLDLVSRMEDAA